MKHMRQLYGAQEKKKRAGRAQNVLMKQTVGA